ncbi:MAG: uroporphyrinogen decarboxylase family protein [Christensenellales bacterium]|jgi:uroporphyrinogen decarboxylase
MDQRKRLGDILAHKSDHCGFWHGDPNIASRDYLFGSLGVADDFAMGLKLGDTCRWVMPETHGMWKHPEGKPMFDVLGGKARHSLGQPGVFAECEDVAEVEKFDWPDAKYVDFTDTIREIDRTVEAGLGVMSGTWSCFFHNACDFFGMENYFVKMYTDPDVVEAVTEHIVQFYLDINEKLFEQAHEKIDLFFFGNDFGSQRDMLISPECFDRFVMPYFVKFTQQAHRFGMKVLLHSCGSIERIIPRLIDAGVNALHPIQAKAANMDAVTLSSKYNGKIVFVGGVDTQELLAFGTPQQVRDEVRRLKDLFGNNYVVSPSHESILPGVTVENVLAMAEAAAE